MPKAKYKDHIHWRKTDLKREMANCLKFAQTQLDLTSKNFIEHSVVPYDFEKYLGLTALENFRIYSFQLAELEELERQLNKKPRKSPAK